MFCIYLHAHCFPENAAVYIFTSARQRTATSPLTSHEAASSVLLRYLHFSKAFPYLMHFPTSAHPSFSLSILFSFFLPPTTSCLYFNFPVLSKLDIFDSAVPFRFPQYLASAMRSVVITRFNKHKNTVSEKSNKLQLWSSKQLLPLSLSGSDSLLN